MWKMAAILSRPHAVLGMPCETTRHGCSLWCLYPHFFLSLFYSYFLSGNKYRKNITCKNIGQFQFCINLLPLELIWRSASCPRHWNQRWFGDAAFTIPSGKQWDHMSPWPPSWLSAGIDECCRSANESGHQLEQLERLRSEDTPPRLMITHTIGSQVKTRTTRTPAFWGYPPTPHDYPILLTSLFWIPSPY